MKTLLKLAMGIAIAGTLVKLLASRTSVNRADPREPLPSADGPITSEPVETINDSAGTPVSATPP